MVLTVGFFSYMSKIHVYKQIHAYVNIKALRLHYIELWNKKPASKSGEAEKIFFRGGGVELGVILRSNAVVEPVKRERYR